MHKGGDSALVYACSGCSNVAQLANRVAVAMDRDGSAEMSCIAGVGGGVPALVAKARSGRFILAIDGCALHCTAACLARAGVTASMHVTLCEHGLRKRYGEDPDDRDVITWREKLGRELHERMQKTRQA